MGIASLILGILSVVVGVGGFLLGPLSIVGLAMGIVAIVLSAIAGKRAKSGLTTGGLVCGIIGTVFCFIPAIIWILAITAVAVSA